MKMPEAIEGMISALSVKQIGLLFPLMLIQVFGHAQSNEAQEVASTSQEEAIEFVKHFPIRNARIPKCPSSASGVLNGIGEGGEMLPMDKIVGWRTVKTVEDEIECQPLTQARHIFEMQASALKEKGEWPGREQFSAEVLGNNADASTEQFTSLLSSSWKAVPLKGNRYYVEATIILRTPQDVNPPSSMTEKWEADMGARTLKPLDVAAWLEIDFKVALKWVAKSKRAISASNLEEVNTGSVAPAYQLSGVEAKDKARLPREQHKTPYSEEQMVLYSLGVAVGRQLGAFNLKSSELDLVIMGITDQVDDEPLKAELSVYGPKIQELAKDRKEEKARAQESGSK